MSGQPKRRQTDRTIAYWLEKSSTGEPPPIELLDLKGENWSHQFLIGVGAELDDPVLLFYGKEIERLLGLRPKHGPVFDLRRHLPERFTEIFLGGCAQAINQQNPVQIDGVLTRPDGAEELFRAAFVPVHAHNASSIRYAFGAFNSRLVEKRR